jgi:hypothetical protein
MRRDKSGGAEDVVADGSDAGGKGKKKRQWTLDGESDDELRGMAESDDEEDPKDAGAPPRRTPSLAITGTSRSLLCLF